MITPDSIPLWPALILAAVLTFTWLVLEFIHAPADPNPTYSRLDRLDGLPHD